MQRDAMASNPFVTGLAIVVSFLVPALGYAQESAAAPPARTAEALDLILNHWRWRATWLLPGHNQGFEYDPGTRATVAVAASPERIAACSCDLGICEAYNVAEWHRLGGTKASELSGPCNDATALVGFLAATHRRGAGWFYQLDSTEIDQRAESITAASLAQRISSVPASLSDLADRLCQDDSADRDLCSAIRLLGRDTATAIETVVLPPRGHPIRGTTVTLSMKAVAALASQRWSEIEPNCSGTFVVPYFDQSDETVLGWFHADDCEDRVFSIESGTSPEDWDMYHRPLVEPAAAHVVQLLSSGEFPTWRVAVP